MSVQQRRLCGVFEHLTAHSFLRATPASSLTHTPSPIPVLSSTPFLQPLHIAALRGHTEAIQTLLDAGLSPSARSSRGWTPLDEACAGRSMAAARLLQRALLAEVKGEMKAKRGQLLDTMRSMPDYSLQVRRCGGFAVAWCVCSIMCLCGCNAQYARLLAAGAAVQGFAALWRFCWSCA
jgi:hypothetical protein